MTKVLLIDDDSLLLSMLGRLMEELGHTATLAHGEVDARREITEDTFDVIISDYDYGLMGTVNGVQLLDSMLDHIPDSTRLCIHSGLYRDVPGIYNFVLKGDTEELLHQLTPSQCEQCGCQYFSDICQECNE